MKKRIFGILMAILMLASLVMGVIPALADEEEGGVTIRFHYHRPDGDYEGWEMWLWDMNGLTPLDPPYALKDEGNGDRVCEFKVKTGTCQIGYIVRKDGWDFKDVTHDQHINITGILEGTVDFYVESGVPTQPNATSIPSREALTEAKTEWKDADGNVIATYNTLVPQEGCEYGIVITANQYKDANRDGDPEITIQLSSALPADEPIVEDTFVLSGSDGVAIPLKKFRGGGQYAYLTLNEKLDLKSYYKVTFRGREYTVSMPDFYASEEFEAEYTYTGNDLGQTYTKEKTTLRLWSPLATSVSVNLYEVGYPVDENGLVLVDDNKKPLDSPYSVIPMTKDVQGTWVVELEGDMNGVYYTYTVCTEQNPNGVEASDPYARAVGINGKRAMIIDLDATDPEGWANDKNPHAGEKYTDAIIYELHVRDLSSDASSGISAEHVGKFLGVIERDTKTEGGIATGLDHIVDLGVTHVHLLPVYDFGSVDETTLDQGDFNWGYDPVNYNVPDGSYSTNPYDGEVRVKEMKQMVKGIHDAGVSVIMDVVYNHVQNSATFCFNQTVLGYFSRPNSNGSGCGNDTATERLMVRKYLVDSIMYWIEEYHIDGFRFDLAGLIDVDTINAITETVHEKYPDIIFYGEGWYASAPKTTKKDVALATQANASKVPEFGFFNDTIRNLIRGGSFDKNVSAGYISGGPASTAELLACFKGLPTWCKSPTQAINYISCHDNHALFDQITLVTPKATQEQRIAMNKLGAAFYMTAQGIPFFQAGEEFLRSKAMLEGEEAGEGRGNGYYFNSYSASDAINSLKWSDLEKPEYQEVYQYYKGLIAFRKAHPALRLDNADAVKSNVTDVPTNIDRVVAYNVKGGMEGEKADNIFVIFNGSQAAANVTLPAGNWEVYVNGQKAGTTALSVVSGQVAVDALSATVLVQHDDITPPPATIPPEEPSNIWMIVCGIIAGLSVVTIAVCIVILLKKK